MISQYLLGHKTEITDGERIWYIAELSGFLMEVHLFSKELKCIWKIPNSADACAYRSLFYHDHKLYIFPYYQSVMYVYDLYTSEYEEIKVKKGLELMGSVKRGQFLYVFGSKSEILKYHLEDHTVTYVDIESKLHKAGILSSDWFWTKGMVLDEAIYIPISNSNMIIRLDQQDTVSSMCFGDKPEKWMLVNIQEENGRYHVLYGKGEAGSIRTYVGEYDRNGKKIQETVMEETYAYQLYPFVNAVWAKDKWICLPFGRNEILLRDGEQDEKLFEMDMGTASISEIIQGLFLCSVSVHDVLYSIEQAAGNLVRIDMKDLTVKSLCLEMEEDLQCLVEESYQDTIRTHSVIKEIKDFYDLKSYIHYIESK